MTETGQEPDGTLPGTVFTPRQVRLLKVAVVVMGIALVGGFALVLGTIVYQASNLGKSAAVTAPAPPADTRPVSLPPLQLKPGERVAGLALDGGRLAVHIEGPEGSAVLLVDMETGRLIARLPVEAE